MTNPHINRFNVQDWNRELFIGITKSESTYLYEHLGHNISDFTIKTEKSIMKKYILRFFAMILCVVVLAGCGNRGTNSKTDGTYTYNDYVSTLATNWNPHTYETASDNYPAQYLRVGFYSLVYNDELHPAEGKEAFTSYSVIPEMAASEPTDVTETVKRDHPEFKIPDGASAGYAYTIDLNPNASWEDGTPINADTYVYSMKRLLDPELLNYRASDYYAGNFSIAGAEEYATGKSGDDFSAVGLYKSGEYQITLVLDKSLGGFNLIYNLTSNFIVYEELYEKCLTKDGNAWFSSYNTSADTTMSYGPYKLTSYQKDKSMRFEKNDEWYGWEDGQHRYIDPESGEEKAMYQTTHINTQVIAEAATAKMMFLRGELASYTLQAEDFDNYKTSDNAYETPGETMFFLILNGNTESIRLRERGADFDSQNYDIEVLTLNSFRRAVALTYDRRLFAESISPARRGGFGLIGGSYVYDPQRMLYYRDTEPAKRVLCDFYSVNANGYETLDDAVSSITGYDPETAREYYRMAFAEGVALGYITDRNNDGISDQTVTIEYCISQDSEFMTKTVDYLNRKMAEVTSTTPFEGRIRFTKSAPYGNDWVSKIKAGLSDTVLGGWSGSVLDPFSLTSLYTDPSYQYDAAWFDSSSVPLTLTLNTAPIGEQSRIETLTLTLRQWSDALNGASVISGGHEYNFGEANSDVDTRLTVLAAIEGAVLGNYNYIPMLEDASVTLLSKQLYYVRDEYNPVMGRGGIAYLSYNYDDDDWKSYVKNSGGELRY